MEDEIYRLKVSGKSIFNQYKENLIKHLIAIIMLPVLNDLAIIPVLGLFLFFDYMNSLSLFIDYYNENKDLEVIIYEKKITLKSKSETRCVNVEDIDQIRIYNSPSRERGLYRYFIMIDSFYYVRIRLKNREDFFLTSLLDHEIDDKLTELFPKQIKRDDARIYNSLEKQNNRKK